jgi:hypothetical protein
MRQPRPSVWGSLTQSFGLADLVEELIGSKPKSA